MGSTGVSTIPCPVVSRVFVRTAVSAFSFYLSTHTCRYSDLNQSASGQIKSGPSGSGVGIITTLLMSVATMVVVVKAVRNPGALLFVFGCASFASLVVDPGIVALEHEGALLSVAVSILGPTSCVFACR